MFPKPSGTPRPNWTKPLGVVVLVQDMVLDQKIWGTPSGGGGGGRHMMTDDKLIKVIGP